MDRKAAAFASRFFIKSFGCQMNVYDATRMADTLGAAGYSETTETKEADIILLNTCHIRERASENVYSTLGRMREIKEERASRGFETLIGVTGCVAQADGAEIFRRQPSVDMVIGTQAYHRLPEAISMAREHHKAIFTQFEIDEKFEKPPMATTATMRSRGLSAFVTIQEGCDKFCTFCVVPYTRGAEVSRPVEKVLVEIRELAANGVREVTLLGQNVNAYLGGQSGQPDLSLAGLIREVAAIDGMVRVRYTTSHPCDVTRDLIEAHRTIEAMMPFMHLPVQSGSDRILKAMNRRHTAEYYRDTVADVRAARPDIALSSDFIVGFPGESDADFAATMALVETVGFASAYAFKYSARPGTPGADLPDRVDDEVKAKRLAALQSILDAQRRAFNAASVGTWVDVLFEKPGNHAGQIAGKTPHHQPIYVMGPEKSIGSVARVEVVELGSNSFRGRLL